MRAPDPLGGTTKRCGGRGADAIARWYRLRPREVRVRRRLGQRQGEARLVTDHAEAGLEVRGARRRHVQHGGRVAAEVAEALPLEVELAAALLLELREHGRVV